MENVFVDLEGKITSLNGEQLKGVSIEDPRIVSFKFDHIDETLLEKVAPKNANAYSNSRLQEMKDSKEGFAITEYEHCYSTAIQFYRIDWIADFLLTENAKIYKIIKNMDDII